MIDKIELRLGNWVSDFGDGYGKVLAIYETGDILTSANPVPQPPECIHPIPLSPDILEKCGLTKVEIFYKFSEYDRLCISIHQEEYFLHDYYDNGWRISKGIKYLHQLMNLHYSLTGKELIVNLP